MNIVAREVGASFLQGFRKCSNADELLVLNLTALGSALLIPHASLAIIVTSTLGCHVARGVAEVFKKYGAQTKKLEQETKAFLERLIELHAVEEKNREELKNLKKSLQESYRIAGVASRILHEGRLKLERKVEKLEPKIQRQQSTVEEIFKRAREEQAISESIRLQCELHKGLKLVVLAEECDSLASLLKSNQKSSVAEELVVLY